MGKFPIFDKIEEELPDDAGIVDTCFEGANIILYTKNEKLFLHSQDLIKSIVDKIKKRVEIRPDQSILMPVSEAEIFIKSKIPAEAELFDIWFDEKRSIVIIEAKKPGYIINSQRGILKEIREKTYWVPKVIRAPGIKSDVIRTIRNTLYKNSEYRRKLLNSIGEKIYSPWERKPNYWVRLSFLGGGRQVGRSCILLQTPESNILLDCGMNVAGTSDFMYPHFEAPEFNINDIDAVILSHSHLDHCGAIPLLFKYGYSGPVYCTKPSRDVSTLILLDAIDISFKDNFKTAFSNNDVKEMIKNTICLDYDVVTDITPDVRMTLHNSGHILGSAMVHLNIGNGFHNVLYTGDMKFAKTKLLNPAVSKFQRVETVVIESTYGASEDIFPEKKDVEQELLDSIIKTIERGGKVIIPVLGTGRAQEILLILDDAIKKKKIPEFPIFLDGMLWNITAVYTAYPSFLNKTLRDKIFKEEEEDPFTSSKFKRVGSQQERMKLVEEEGPCVILATSGMLTGGPSVFYLEKLCDNPKNSLIFVSYQAEGSLGRKLQRGETQILISSNGVKTENMKINLEVITLYGITGHSGRNELMDFIQKMKPMPRRVIINHGEASKCLDLASAIHKTFRIETIAPKNLDAVRIR